MSDKTTKRGWHATKDQAPHTGRGSATVEPIRSRSDIDKIKRALLNRPRDLTLFTLGVNWGLRGSDLLALRWDDVLSPEGRIKTKVVVTEAKTGRARRFMVSDTVRKALRTWLELSGDIDRGDLLFPSRKGGGPMTIQRLHQLVNEWASLAGLHGHWGTHTLRKTYGYQLRMAGHDIVKLMDIFGHSSQAITLRYIGIEQDEIDEANMSLNL